MSGKTLDNSRPKADDTKPPPPTEWWLRVRDDFSEARFEGEPTAVKTLHVFLIKYRNRYWEETRTRSLPVKTHAGVFKGMEACRPQGVGWKLYANNRDHSIWRRARRPAGPLLPATATYREICPLPKPPGSGRYDKFLNQGF